MGGNGTISATTESPSGEEDAKSWEGILAVFEIVNILLLAVTFWILPSMIAYGTKKKLWTKNPGASGMSSGAVFVTSVVAAVLFLLKLGVTGALYRYQVPENATERCELIGDISAAGYASSTFAVYFLLWIRIRLIYIHPYMKERVSQLMGRLCICALPVLAVISVGVLCLYLIPSSYRHAPYGCVLKSRENGGFARSAERSALLAVTLLLAQLTLVCLAVYPAVRVRFLPGDESDDPAQSGTKAKVLTFFLCRTGASSPVEMTVRRTMLSSVVVVVSDILAIAVDTLAFELSSPIALRQSVYDISLLVNMFCILATFGFAARVLTLPFHFCWKMKFKRRKRPVEMVAVSGAL